MKFFLLYLLLFMAACSENQISGKPGVDETSNGITLALVDSTGAALPGTAVSLFNPEHVPGTGKSDLEFTSDTNGLVFLKGLNRKSFRVLATLDTLMAFQQINTTALENQKQAKITLNPAGSLEGKLELGFGMYDLKVGVLGSNLEANVDEKGQFSFPEIPGGTLEFIIFGGKDGEIVQLDTIQIKKGKTSTLPKLAELQIPENHSVDKIHFYANTASAEHALEHPLQNFPLRVRINKANHPKFFDSELGTLRFYAKEGTPQPFEISYWNEEEGIAEFWVLLDSIAVQDNQLLSTLLYSSFEQKLDTAASEVFAADKGWTGVWHLTNEIANQEGKNLSPDATDSGQNLELTQSFPDDLLDGIPFDGAQQRGVINTTKVDFGAGEFTMYAWIAKEGPGSVLLEKQDQNPEVTEKEKVLYFGNGLDLLTSAGDRPSFLSWNENPEYFHHANLELPETQWVMLSLTAKNDANTWYLNAEHSGTANFAVSPDNPEHKLYLGGHPNRTPESEITHFVGRLKYLHFSKTAHSPEFIRFTYLNQMPNSNLLYTVED